MHHLQVAQHVRAEHQTHQWSGTLVAPIAATERLNPPPAPPRQRAAARTIDGHGEPSVALAPAGPGARSRRATSRHARGSLHASIAGAGAGAVCGLHGRAAGAGGVPGLRAGGEHGGGARPVLLLGAQGRGARGGGLPLPALPGRPGLRPLAQHDQGPAAARRVQGQDAARQQVPRFCSWCAQRVSCSGSLVRGPRLRAVADAVAVNPFGITGSNREPDQRSSAFPSAFRRCRPLGTTTGLHLHRCRDSVGVPGLVSWAHSPEFMRSARTLPQSDHKSCTERCIL